MGENATIPNLLETFDALDRAMKKLGVPLKASMKEIFEEAVK